MGRGMAQKKKHADIIDTTAKSFFALWHNRQDLLALALFPFAVKVVTFMVVIALGLQDNMLRQGLFFIPSFFVEGWFVAASLRLALYNERWPFFLTGDAQRDRSLIKNRRTAIQSAGVLYTLLRLISVVCVAVVMRDATQGQQMLEGSMLGDGQAPTGAEDPVPVGVSAMALVGAMILLAGTLWAYRYFCLYVPVALGYSMKSFLKAIWGFKGSFQLIFISIICFIPFFVIFGALHGGLESAFPNATLDMTHWGYGLAFSVVQSVMEVMVSLTTAIALGFFVVAKMKRV